MSRNINVLVRRRNGTINDFDVQKISTALMNAFIGTDPEFANSQSVRDRVDDVVNKALDFIYEASMLDSLMDVEFIQDCVERALMAMDEHSVLRAYILYRESHAKNRQEAQAEAAKNVIQVKHGNRMQSLNTVKIHAVVQSACQGLTADAELLMKNFYGQVYNGMSQQEVFSALVLAARPLIETHPDYAYVAARLHFHQLRKEVIGRTVTPAEMKTVYPLHFKKMIQVGIQNGRLDPAMADFDLNKLSKVIQSERDNLFQYQGAQILTDRYLIHVNGRHIELPQSFFMRVAMGLALNEAAKNDRAIEFYNVLSSHDWMTSTPTLFNAGTTHPQLSSCFLSTVSDDLVGIYDAIKENALLSKYSGGLGNDWTPVRGLGSYINGTNGQSQGIIPFLKVVNDTAVAVNQCFGPDTLIHTQDGPKPIRHIEKGDLVLGISGTYREVKERMTYAQKDDMVAIDVHASLMPVQVTTGHPVMAIQNVKNGEAVSRTMQRINSGKIVPDWIETGALKDGDYVAQVIPEEVVPVAGFTDDDAYMYGIMLGDGHITQQDGVNREYGITLHLTKKIHLADFVRNYLNEKGVHFWEDTQHGSALCIHWAYGRTALRDVVNGQFISGEDSPTLPFTFDDMYTVKNEKRVAARFLHLPESQTLAILKGLIQTDGRIDRRNEISFTTTSITMAENVRYMLLRLGVPSYGRMRDSQGEQHKSTRKDDSHSGVNGSLSYELSIPAYPLIADCLGCEPTTKYHELRIGKWLFSRVKSVLKIDPLPFVCDLKVDGDESYMTTALLAHNGGKRKGAVCAYLETWHIDMDEFLDLRKNTGDDRRRTHDMNTANWIPDLFMERVEAKAEWTLFSPNDVPDLHDLYGAAFKERYEYYEKQADKGKITLFKRVSALDMWRKMLTMLLETGHPWITFKDPCNIRSPQQHVGTVHSSNLCTEITLNSTSDTETAVCNLGSINLVNHMKSNKHGGKLPENLMDILDIQKMQRTIRTGMRMLDNVIDMNYYAVDKARNSNLRHRPVGVGVMGFVDAMSQYGISYKSDMAVEFADVSQEAISYYAIEASADLAQERGAYESFAGSLWSKGILPIDSLEMLEEVRHIDVDRTQRMNWAELREKVVKGMRNSNCLAIAPTATIANIIGVSQGIEPIYQNLYVKSNLSGEFTVLNANMVKDMIKMGIWDAAMLMDLKFYDGSLSQIDRVPQHMKDLYVTAFEMDSMYLIRAAARRQKWLDQAQSLNLYFNNPKGKELNDTYMSAWKMGLKTTYYLRSISASSAEKSTGKAGSLNAVAQLVEPSVYVAPKACLIDDPECESCQ